MVRRLPADPRDGSIPYKLKHDEFLDRLGDGSVGVLKKFKRLGPAKQKGVESKPPNSPCSDPPVTALALR